MAISGLLGDGLDTLDAGDWTRQMQRRRPAEGAVDPGAIVLPPDQGTLFYTEQDISPQWAPDMERVVKALRALGAI